MNEHIIVYILLYFFIGGMFLGYASDQKVRIDLDVLILWTFWPIIIALLSGGSVILLIKELISFKNHSYKK